MGNAEISPKLLKALSEARLERIRDVLKKQEEGYAISLQNSCRQLRKSREKQFRNLFDSFIGLAVIFWEEKDKDRYKSSLGVALMLQYLMHHDADFSEFAPEFVLKLIMHFLNLLSKTLQTRSSGSLEPTDSDILRRLEQLENNDEEQNHLLNKIMLAVVRGSHDETGAYCTVTAACRAAAQLYNGYKAGTPIGDEAECGERKVGGLRTMIKLPAPPAATVGRSKYYPAEDILDAMDAKGVFEEMREAVDTITRGEVFRRIQQNKDIEPQGFIDKHRNH